jgi:hypothetical protein
MLMMLQVFWLALGRSCCLADFEGLELTNIIVALVVPLHAVVHNPLAERSRTNILCASCNCLGKMLQILRLLTLILF